MNWMPGVSVCKESASNSEDKRDTGLIPGSGRSTGGRHSNPLEYSCLRESHGQRSLAGYNPQGSQRVRYDSSDWAHNYQNTNDIFQS